MGQHAFAVIENGELAPLERRTMPRPGTVRGWSPAPTATVGTLEASRVIVGPQCGLAIEVYGTQGSATWNFEQMNELRLCLGRGGSTSGTHRPGNSSMGDYARFQPGPAQQHSYDDLKVIEAMKFSWRCGRRAAQLHDLRASPTTRSWPPRPPQRRTDCGTKVPGSRTRPSAGPHPPGPP